MISRRQAQNNRGTIIIRALKELGFMMNSTTGKYS
jgi:hypothetical protein